MLNKIRKTGGFTLIEVMIAMTIFVLFTGVLLNSYVGIVRSQRETNDYREMYVEARKVFERITEELRAGSIYYGETYNFSAAQKEIHLFSPDGSRTVLMGFSDEAQSLKILESLNCQDVNFLDISPKLKVEELSFYVTPQKDPYLNMADTYLQFQPKVTVYAKFSQPKENGENFVVDFQTTVSSRAYSSKLIDTACITKLDAAILAN